MTTRTFSDADMASPAPAGGGVLSDEQMASGPASADQSYVAGLLRSLVGQGVLMGWGDETMAALRKLAGEDYDKSLVDERSKVAAFRKENPKTALAAELGGGFLTPGVGLLTGVLRPAASTLGRMAQGSVLGSAMGATAGAGAAEDDRLSGAAHGATLGAALGPAAPLAGKAVSAVVERGTDLLGPTFARAGAHLPGRRGTPAEAAADFVMTRDLQSEGATPASLRKFFADADSARTFHGGVGAANASEAASPVSLMEASPALRRTVGSAVRASPGVGSRAEAFIGTRQTGAEPASDRARAFATEGGLEFRNPLSPLPDRAVLDSPAGQHERIRGGLQRAYQLADTDFHGFGENAYRTEKEMVKALKAKADELYGDLRKAAAGYDVRKDMQPAIAKWTDELEDAQLTEGNLIRKALRQFTTDGKEWVKTVDGVDKGKRAVDSMIEVAERAGDRNAVRVLKSVRDDFVAAVDNIKTNGIGEKWQAARGYFSTEKQRQEAIEWGRNAARAESNATADEFAEFPDGLKKLARLGILEGLERQAGPSRRAADLTQVLETNRMQALLRETIPRAKGSGRYSEQPERFGDYVANEKAMIRSRDKVLGNSATAERLADDQRLTRQTLAHMFERFKSGNLGAVPLVMEAVSAGLTRFFGFREDVAQELGRRMLTANRAEIERIIARLEVRWGADKVGAFTRFLTGTSVAASAALPAATGRAAGESKR
jgi:hypothetical protein